MACPWASRAYIFMKLKKLEGIISLSIVSPNMMENGWTFKEDFPGVIPDNVFHKKYLHQVYAKADPEFSGKVTVPVLFDKKTNTIVNNESSDIIRIFNTAFNKITGDENDFYPESLRSEIDTVNAFVYEKINNGVYKAGFADSQEAYEESVESLFKALDKIEERLEGREALLGAILTEADVRLYTTLIRFDLVYHGHFKCNLKMLKEYKNISRYLKMLYDLKAFRETTSFEHIKQHYYYSQIQINPNQIIPKGPENIFADDKPVKIEAVEKPVEETEEIKKIKDEVIPEQEPLSRV
jgi:putative glutathione S-transferase